MVPGSARRCVLALWFAVCLIAASAAHVRAEEDCPGACGTDECIVLFSQVPDAHYRNSGLRSRFLHARSKYKGVDYRQLRLSKAGQRQLAELDREKAANVCIQLGDCCIALPPVYRREAYSEHAVVFASRPSVGRPRAYIAWSPPRKADGSVGVGVPVAYVVYEWAGGQLQIVAELGGDGQGGRMYGAQIARGKQAIVPVALGRQPPVARPPGPGHGGQHGDDTSRVETTRTEERLIRRAMRRHGHEFWPRRVLDLIVGFTQDVRIAADSDLSVIENKAVVGAARFHDALTNTGLGSYHVLIKGYVDTGMIESVAGSANSSVSFDESLLIEAEANTPLRFQRRRTKSDVATLFIDRFGGWGRAKVWADGAWWPVMAPHAYSICQWDQVGLAPVLAHEIGHNLGGGHTPTGYDPNPLAFAVYSHGHCVLDEGWPYCTVLGQAESGGHTTLYVFSNPYLVHSGTGLPLGAVGLRENARTLRRNFRWATVWGQIIQFFP